jgi:hypothetical protein
MFFEASVPRPRIGPPVLPRGLCGFHGRNAMFARRVAGTPQVEEAEPVPRRAGDGAGDGGEACIGRLPPHEAAGNDGDGVRPTRPTTPASIRPRSRRRRTIPICRAPSARPGMLGGKRMARHRLKTTPLPAEDFASEPKGIQEATVGVPAENASAEALKPGNRTP